MIVSDWIRRGLGSLSPKRAAIGLTLPRSPMTVARRSGIGQLNELASSTQSATQSATYCQGNELLPRDASAIRVSLFAGTGPHVAVVVTSDRGRPVTRGERGSGWTGGAVTIPVEAVPHSVSGVTVCTSSRVRDETVSVNGRATARAIPATARR